MLFRSQITHAIGHMHLTSDTDGGDVLIWTNSNDPQPIQNCPNGIVKVALSNGHQTCLLQLDWSLAAHITAGDGDGWVFVETYDPADPPASIATWKPYANEIIQVKLDGTETRRLLHHRSRQTATYGFQPRATVSRDGRWLVFTSNYALQTILGYPVTYTDAYMVSLCTPGGAFDCLTVAKSGTGFGTVTSFPAGIDCGSDCSERYASGTVTLSATAASGSTFTGWSGPCGGTGTTCQITTGAPRSLTATFATAAAPSNFLVTNTLDSGPNSLRWAIEQANAKVGLDYVTFSIPGSGLQNIVVGSTLPITDQVVVDGTTQAGYGSPGPRVYVRGGATVETLFSLGSGSGWSTIQGLGLMDYGTVAITTTTSAQGSWIQYNWIGFYRADDGTVTVNSALHPMSRGLTLQTSWTTVRWNTISGVQEGIVIGDDLDAPAGNTYVTNAVQANAIGTDPWTWTATGYGNTGVGVRLLAGAQEMWIGPWNVVSGNASGGLQMLHSGNWHNVVFGNYVGTNSAGTALIPNGGVGISLANGAHENAIGGSWGGNLIAGNPTAGVSLSGVNNNWVQNNTIGLNASQTAVLGGQQVGVTVSNNATLNSIEGNVLAGNTQNGAMVDRSTSNSVSRNHVGRSSSGTLFANGNYGIVLLGGANYNWVFQNNFGTNPLGNFYLHPNAVGNIF